MSGYPGLRGILLAGPGLSHMPTLCSGLLAGFGENLSSLPVTRCGQRFGERWELLGQKHSSPVAPYPVHW